MNWLLKQWFSSAKYELRNVIYKVMEPISLDNIDVFDDRFIRFFIGSLKRKTRK